MAKPARLWAFSTLVALSALALGCNGTTEDDTAGPEGGSAGTAGSSSPAAGTSSTGGAMGAAGSGTTAGSGGGGTAGDSAMMNGAGMPGGAGRAAAAGSGGRAAGGKSGGAGAPAGGAGTSGGAGTASAGMGGMAVGLADCPMPPAETPATAITALNTENTLRVAMGLDCAIIALPLCKSAQSHCDYYTQNQGTMCEAASPHDEIADCPGFTGEGLGERFKAAGYTLSGSGSEDMCFLDDPEKAVMTFVNSVYHRTSILDPWMRDFGYGNSDGCDTIDFGTGMKSDKALTAVYPYPDQTGIPTSFDGSREGPTPPMPSSGWPSGFPVTVYAQNFTVTSHVITVDGSTDELAHQYLDETDPTLPKYAKFLYTDAPMTANTKYHVVVSGTIGGTAKTFDWSFTTGAASGGGRPRP